MVELVEFDLEAAREGVSQLTHWLGPMPELVAMSKALDDYDSDLALANLSKLSESLNLNRKGKEAN
jgi:hypothetical protein